MRCKNSKLIHVCSGFVEEGRKREVNWIDGHWEDNIAMGILFEEWEASKST